MTDHVELLPVQQQFVDSDAWVVGFLADRPAGKTTAGAVKAIKKILQGESGVIVAPSFSQFATATFPGFTKWAPMEFLEKRNRQRDHPYTVHRTLKFDIDGKIVSVYYGDANSWMWRALDRVSWLWLDGVMGVKKRNFDILHERILRSPDSQAWITATDPGPDPTTHQDHWITDMFNRGLRADKKLLRSGRALAGRCLSASPLPLRVLMTCSSS